MDRFGCLHFVAVKQFSSHCLAIKSLYVPQSCFNTGHTLCGFLIRMQNIRLQSSGTHRQQKFSSPLLSLFLPHFFFFAGHLVGFAFVGKGFGKSFSIKREVGG